MLRMVYTSKAVAPLDDPQISGLLAVSRTNNDAYGISGLLIYHQEQFFQVLEGPDEAVRRCFKRIAKDNRHDGVKILDEIEVEERAFAKWKMGLIRPQGLPTDLRGRLVAACDLLVSGSEERGLDPRVRRQVRAFFARCEFLRHESGLSRSFNPPPRADKTVQPVSSWMD
jgi:hypothetical protein